MTTTGDLFVNIKGNNRGLKQSLDRSSRDIQNFSKKAEKAVGGGSNALSNVFQGGTAAAALFGTGAYDRYKQFTGSGYTKRRGVLYGATHTAEEVRNKRIETVMSMIDHRHPKHEQFKKHRIGPDGSTTSQRFRAMDQGQTLRNVVGKTLGFMASMPGAVATVGAAVAIADANKQAKRVNEAALQYNGRTIAHQTRLEVQNMRKDIRLARNPALAASSRLRMSAADFRMNSGMAGNGLLGNIAGSVYDGAVGTAQNAIFGLPGLVNNIMQWTQTAGGIK